MPGTVCSPEGRHADRIRLPFVAEPEAIEEACAASRAWREYAPARSEPPKERRAPGVLV